MNNLDRKYIWVSLIIFSIIILYYFFDSYFLEFFKTIFESKFTYVLVGGYSFTVTLLHFVKFNQSILKDKLSFQDFKNYFELLSNPAISVTSLSLAKGLFMQQFFEGDYFRNFSEIEIALLYFVVFYLLFISFMEMKKLTKEAFTITNIENAEPGKGNDKL